MMWMGGGGGYVYVYVVYMVYILGVIGPPRMNGRMNGNMCMQSIQC